MVSKNMIYNYNGEVLPESSVMIKIKIGKLSMAKYRIRLFFCRTLLKLAFWSVRASDVSFQYEIEEGG